ncbi:YfhO family protein [Eupransor demetentiae]|uniref:Uncharacterized membrane protein YfhO (YfhO) n=1 Tax=Eupransor demetentiae TaxID=3109584 RepID=A0ABP0EMJ4_9LACO|nr:Uncharacterized membrane protein YfhO (YfhO) [Lactobacillaceae bacterium LMG 33000]
MKNIKATLTKLTISPLALSFWIPVLIMGGYYASRGMMPFGHSTILTVDLGQQYIDQFAEFKHTLLNHPGSFFYSFANGLGGDMLSEWAYYLMSPFNLIFLLAKPMTFPAVILFVTLLKFGCAGLTMAYALKKLGLQKGYYLTLFAINYPLSGWFIANDLNLLWLDSAIILPLIILALEKLLRGGKWWPFALLLTASFILNYYIAYMMAIFIGLYFFWRLFQVGRPLWPKIKAFSSAVLTALGLAAWLLIPVFQQLQGSKVQHNSELHWGFDNDPIKLIVKLIPGSFDFQQMQDGQANFYVAAFALIALLAFFLQKGISRWVKLGAFGILFIFFLATTWAPLTIAFHGGQYPVWYPDRFSFIISFFIILLGAWAYHPDQLLDWKIRLTALVLMLGVVAYAWTQLGNLAYVQKDNITIFFLLSGLILIQLSAIPSGAIQLTFLLLTTVLALAINVSSTLHNFSYIGKDDYQNTIRALDASRAKIKGDHGWYRVGQDFERTRGDSMMEDYFGGSHFSSLVTTSTGNFYQNMGLPAGDNNVIYSNGTVITDSLLGFKYFFSGDDQFDREAGSPLARKMATRPDFNQYKFFARTDNTKVWKNPNALAPVYAANNKALKTNFTDSDPMHNQATLFQNLTGQASSALRTDNFESAVGHNLTVPDNLTNVTLAKKDVKKPASMDLYFTPSNSGPYYLTLGGNLKISDFDLFVNDKIVTQFATYRSAVVLNIADNVKGKQQKLTIRLRNDSIFTSQMALYHFDQKQLQSGIQNLQQNQISLSKHGQRSLSGDITTTKAKPLIMTSIPSDPGWQIYLDGKKVKGKQVGDYLLAIPSKPGKHHLTLRYTPRGFKYGYWITAFACFTLIMSVRPTKRPFVLQD